MNSFDISRTDGLAVHFYAHCDPLAVGGLGLEPFLDALEAHAGELMPTLVSGKRRRKYSRANFAKGCVEGRDECFNFVTVHLNRPPSPEVDMSLGIVPTPGPRQLHLSLFVLPLAFFQEPAQALERSQRMINLIRAWASHYPPTYASAHSNADRGLHEHWPQIDMRNPGREPPPLDRPYAVHWLNVFGGELVDTLGRERVLSTPAHIVEELPTGAVLIVTRPTVADFASEEARVAQARALVHLQPELEFNAVLRDMRERSAALAPVEPRFDPDVSNLWFLALDTFAVSERQRRIAEWNQRPVPEVDEWLPAEAAPPSDVSNPKATIEEYEDLAENLVILFHSDVPSIFKETPEALTEVDLYFWLKLIPERYDRATIERMAVPAAGAYLGQVLVSRLGGRWVPRRNLEETQVVIGDRAWLPFVRARRWSQSRQSVLDYSLTKLYREAERHLEGGRGSR